MTIVWQFYRQALNRLPAGEGEAGVEGQLAVTSAVEEGEDLAPFGAS